MAPPEDDLPQPEPGEDAGGDDLYPVHPPPPLPDDSEPSADSRALDELLDRLDPRGSGQERFQFSLSEMLLLMVAASVLLSFVSILPGGHMPETYATLFGMGLLASLIFLGVLKPERAIVQVAWRAVLVFYVVACVFAVAWHR
jgi:hypothetical protein